MARSIARFVDSNRRIRETPRRDECASTRDLDAREDASARAVVRGGKRREKNMKTRARARASSDGRPCGNAACGTKVGVTEATARAIGVGGFLMTDRATARGCFAGERDVEEGVVR